MEEGDKATTKRIEVYTENSNALVLLGFEKILKGEEEKSIMKEYEQFGESFFPKNKFSQKCQGLDFVGERLVHQQEENIFGLMGKPTENMK